MLLGEAGKVGGCGQTHAVACLLQAATQGDAGLDVAARPAAKTVIFMRLRRGKEDSRQDAKAQREEDSRQDARSQREEDSRQDAKAHREADLAAWRFGVTWPHS
jgi:hypothetical protein